MNRLLQRTDRALSETLPNWGVLLLESHHSERFTMDWRIHDFMKVIYVLHGRGNFFLGGQTLHFKSGDVIVVPPHVKNRIEDSPQVASSLYVCCIAERIWSFDSQIAEHATATPRHSDLQFTYRIASAMRRIIHQQPLETSQRPISIVSDALRILEILVQRNGQNRSTQSSEGSDRSIIKRYVEDLPAKFFEEQSLDQTCHALGVSRRTFTKYFQQLTGRTWLNHIRYLAVEYAKRRLRHTDLPVTSIAFECGFNDLSTFYRQFKRQCRMTPLEYREGNRQAKDSHNTTLRQCGE